MLTTNVPTMYGQRGVDDSYYSIGGGNIGPEPSVNCTFTNAANSVAPCKVLLPNTWYEFTWAITVNSPSYYAGSGGAGCAAPSHPASHIQLWIDGVKIIDNPCASIGYDNAAFGDGDGIGTMEFDNYHTNAMGVNHAGNTWYTELIASTNPICMVGQTCSGSTPPGSTPPGSTPDMVPPSPPANLRIQ